MMSHRCILRPLVALRPLLASPLPQASRHICKKPTTPSCRILLRNSTAFSTSTRHHSLINIQDKEDFTKQVVNSDLPVVIAFHATWCGPCKMLAPRLEKAVAAHKDKVVLARIDIDELQELAITHGVQAVPTVIAMKKGKIVEQFVGLKDDDQLESFVAKVAG